MSQPDFILLEYGESRGLAVIRRLSFWTAFAAIVLAPADLMWRLGLVALLLGLHGLNGNQVPRGRVRLYRDGGVQLLGRDEVVSYRRGSRGWVSRWFSVVTLVDPVRKVRRHIIVCAADNPARDYRRLLGWLRMLPPEAGQVRGA